MIEPRSTFETRVEAKVDGLGVQIDGNDLLHLLYSLWKLEGGLWEDAPGGEIVYEGGHMYRRLFTALAGQALAAGSHVTRSEFAMWLADRLDGWAKARSLPRVQRDLDGGVTPSGPLTTRKGEFIDNPPF